MTTLVKKYPVFEDNQVLTSSQLNSLVEYLDQQNRLTRVSLIGVGILCGLDLSCQSVEGVEQLTISGGVGVTSEGYLVKMKDCVNTRIRPYDLPEGVIYPPFINPVTDEQDVELFELLTDTADVDEEVDEIVPLVKTEIDDMVVMLFVECLDKDLKSCLGKSCDQLGIDRFLTIRKLLVSRADYALIMSRTGGGYQDVQFPDRFNLPKVVMPRTLFHHDQIHSENYFYYSINFLPAILSTASNLIGALKSSYTVYEPILEPSYGENPFDSTQLQAIYDEWLLYLTGADSGILPFFSMQYFAGFIKDLAQAYCEFTENACLLTSLCCSDTDRFPKHLTLGVISANSKGNVSTEFRHQFTQPPVYGNQKELSVKVVQLHEKLVAMIENFSLDRLLKPDFKTGETKITPSCEKKSLMSERSIPFYYDINKESSFEELEDFETLWQASQKNKFGREVLSYAKNNINASTIDPVQTPLDFDLDPYNFLRIEGHLGENVNTVMTELERIKKKKNLAFDIKAIYLGENGLAMDFPECLCSDLQTDYSIWRNKCLFLFKSVLALTSRLGNLYNKRASVTKAFLSEFQPEKATFSPAAMRSKAKGKVKSGPMLTNLSRVSPINVNKTKLSNWSDIQLNVNKENWHLAGKQIVASLDKVKVAEKSSNDLKSFAALSARKSVKDFFDFFNDCLCRLIDSMKVDLKEFDLEVWKKEYACTFQTHIEIMKQLADQASNPRAHLQAYVILIIYCAVYRALCMMGIYPYISIGVISQALEFRKDKFQEALKLSNFIEKHPGIEHKAGVAQGDTFLLLYQAEETRRLQEGKPFPGTPFPGIEAAAAIKNLRNLKLPDFKTTPEEISKIIENFNNRVVGDFTLPYTCCDDCSDMPNAALPLNPIALPVCGVVIANFGRQQESQFPFFSEFRPLDIKMINYVYERETFGTRLNTSPKYGTAELTQIDSSFEFKIVDGKKGEARQVEQLTYTVDLDVMSKVFKKDPNIGILVDEFEYEFFNLEDPNEIICKSTVTIFIPLISRDVDQEPQTATVTGRVMLGETPFPGATVTIKDSNIEPVTTTSGENGGGEFAIKGVPEGEQTLEIRHKNIFNLDQVIQVEAPLAEARDIFVTRRTTVTKPSIDFTKAFKAFGIEPETPEAFKVVDFYVNNTNRYRANLDLMAKTNTGLVQPVLKESIVLVKDFSETKDLNIKTFNEDFTTGTEKIDTALRKANEKEKLVLQETMSNVTLSFLTRLSVEQPKKLTATTTKAMTDFSSLATAKKYPELKGSVAEWAKKSEGNVSPDFLKNVDKNLTLK